MQKNSSDRAKGTYICKIITRKNVQVSSCCGRYTCLLAIKVSDMQHNTMRHSYVECTYIHGILFALKVIVGVYIHTIIILHAHPLRSSIFSLLYRL